MRTTLTIDEDLGDALKDRARLLNVPFRQVVNDALRRGLSPAPTEDRAVFRITPLPGGFQPGIDPARLNQLNDELEAESFTSRDSS